MNKGITTANGHWGNFTSQLLGRRAIEAQRQIKGFQMIRVKGDQGQVIALVQIGLVTIGTSSN